MSSLREEAEAIIRELALLDILGRFGQARLIGSVALDLIVKRDIDLHLLTSEDLFAIADRLYCELLEREEIVKVTICDYRPNGVKIGVDAYPGPTGAWDIELFLTNRVEATGFALADRLCRELTSEHRHAILQIKEHYYRHNQLYGGLSKAIYLAVLESGIRTVEEFERYRERNA
ncbi:MAG: hypothetical protein ACYDCO_14975 [Armatimonadota bacterium]